MVSKYWTQILYKYYIAHIILSITHNCHIKARYPTKKQILGNK